MRASPWATTRHLHQPASPPTPSARRPSMLLRRRGRAGETRWSARRPHTASRRGETKVFDDRTMRASPRATTRHLHQPCFAAHTVSATPTHAAASPRTLRRSGLVSATPTVCVETRSHELGRTSYVLASPRLQRIITTSPLRLRRRQRIARAGCCVAADARGKQAGRRDAHRRRRDEVRQKCSTIERCERRRGRRRGVSTSPLRLPQRQRVAHACGCIAAHAEAKRAGQTPTERVETRSHELGRRSNDASVAAGDDASSPPAR